MRALIAVLFIIAAYFAGMSVQKQHGQQLTERGGAMLQRERQPDAAAVAPSSAKPAATAVRIDQAARVTELQRKTQELRERDAELEGIRLRMTELEKRSGSATGDSATDVLDAQIAEEQRRLADAQEASSRARQEFAGQSQDRAGWVARLSERQADLEEQLRLTDQQIAPLAHRARELESLGFVTVELEDLRPRLAQALKSRDAVEQQLRQARRESIVSSQPPSAAMAGTAAVQSGAAAAALPAAQRESRLQALLAQRESAFKAQSQASTQLEQLDQERREKRRERDILESEINRARAELRAAGN